MSAKKGFETKITEDENIDSGFLSGTISEQLLEEFHSGEVQSEKSEKESDDKSHSEKVSSEKVEKDQVLELDSGLSLSGCLEGLSLGSATPTAAPSVPSVTLSTPPETLSIPPLAILFQQDDDGDNQLHISAVHGCQKSMSTLIRVCPNRYILDAPNDCGHSALHLAVMSGHALIARMLVRAGASIGTMDIEGNTPVHLATLGKHIDCLNGLLAPTSEQISDKKRQTQRQLATSVLSQKNYEGQRCVHLAARMGSRQLLKTLILYGADINSKEGLAGWTPLHIAVSRGDVKLTQFLIQQPGVDLKARDCGNRTPRTLAKRMRTFNSNEAQRLLASLPEDSDNDSDSDDEYDSDEEVEELLFDKLRSAMTVTSLVTN